MRNLIATAAVLGLLTGCAASPGTQSASPATQQSASAQQSARAQTAQKGKVLSAIDGSFTEQVGNFLWINKANNSDRAGVLTDPTGKVPSWTTQGSMGGLLDLEGMRAEGGVLVAVGDQKGTALAKGARVLERLEPETGRVLWSITPPAHMRDWHAGNGLVQVVEETANVSVDNSRFLDAGSGKELYRFTTESGIGNSDISNIDKVVVIESLAPFLTTDHDSNPGPRPTSYQLRDPKTGKVLPRILMKAGNPPRLYQTGTDFIADYPGDFGVQADGVTRFSADGKVRWSVKTTGGLVSTDQDFAVINVRETKNIVVLNAKDGTEHLVINQREGSTYGDCGGANLLSAHRLLVLNCKQAGRPFVYVIQL